MRSTRKKALFLLALASTTLMACGHTEEPSTSVEPTTSVTPTTSEPSSNTTPTPSTSTPEPSTSTVEGPEMNTSDALKLLNGSPYSNPMRFKENLGLSNPSIVGVDKERFENEWVDEVPKEGTIYLAEELGITENAINNSGTLSLFLNSIKSVEGNKIIQFKSGTYPFSAKVDTVGIKDLYLVGEDNTNFVYSGWGTYFDARAAKNIHIININFDMKYSPTIAGKIKRFTEGSGSTVVYIDVPQEFDLTQSLYTNWEGKYGSYMECYLDENTGKYVPDRNGNLVYNTPTGSTNTGYKGIFGVSYDNANRELAITINQKFVWDTYKTPVIGKMVSFAYTMYDNFGFYFQDCEEVYMEHVNVYVAGGMGLRADRGKNFYLNHVSYAPKEGSARIMTCTADIIHTIGVEGDLQITNCRLAGSHDDALNIKSFYLKITDVNASAREISVSQTQNECPISNYEVGDTIDVYDTEVMGLVDTFKIVDVVKQGTSFTFTVDKRPSKKIVEGLCVGNDTKSTRMKLDNTIIENKRNRGILLQTRYSEITNCTFQNVVMGPIQVLAVNDTFREAIVPKNILIANNKFLNNMGTDLAIFAYGNGTSDYTSGTIQGVEVENNYFYNGSGNAIWLLANGGTKVHNNLIHYTKKVSSLLVRVVGSSDVNVSNNVFYTTLDITLSSNVDCTNYVEKDNEKKGA